MFEALGELIGMLANLVIELVVWLVVAVIRLVVALCRRRKPQLPCWRRKPTDQGRQPG